jgi:hypothetical protein
MSEGRDQHLLQSVTFHWPLPSADIVACSRDIMRGLVGESKDLHQHHHHGAHNKNGAEQQQLRPHTPYARKVPCG